MATEYGNRLKAAQAHARLTQKVIASRVGMGQGSLSELMSSGHGSSLTAQIAKVCGVNPHWLATGEGKMLEVVNAETEKFKEGFDIEAQLAMLEASVLRIERDVIDIRSELKLLRTGLMSKGFNRL